MSNYIRSFNRYELKYLLDFQHAKEVIEHLQDYVVPDPYGDRFGNYVLSSLYFDSDDFLFYWEKQEGLKYRRKLRIRIYETKEKVTPNTPAFVEIKERIDKIIRKRRIRMPYKDAITLCHERKMIKVEKKDELIVEEILHMLHAYDLHPQCITSYHRRAFNGTKFDPNLRITFDTNLRYRRENLDLSEKKMGKFMFPPETVIMEVKANNSIPYWITQFVADHNIQLQRVSKYCAGLERAQENNDVNYQII